MRIAWIGLGSMGRPMALSALRGGHHVAGFARRPEEHDELRRAGGEITSSVQAAVAGAEVVCVNLFSEAQIREVVVGRALTAIPAGAVLVIHSTVSPAFMQELGTLRGDIHVLDAGFSGSPEDAANGRLTLMCGGDAAVLETVRPVLQTYADHIAHLGPLGGGMRLKVINNLMFAAHVAIARDALGLLAQGGVSLDQAVPTLLRGSAGSNALGFIGRSGAAPTSMVDAIRPYLEKDVPIALGAAGGLDLGLLEVATREFVPV